MLLERSPSTDAIVDASVARGARHGRLLRGPLGPRNDSHMPWTRSLTEPLRVGRTVGDVDQGGGVLDLLMMAMTVVFFALAFLFVKALDRV